MQGQANNEEDEKHHKGENGSEIDNFSTGFHTFEFWVKCEFWIKSELLVKSEFEKKSKLWILSKNVNFVKLWILSQVWNLRKKK